MVSNTYLTYHEERPREQWGMKLASLKKMIDDAMASEKDPDENLEILSKRCDEMGALFQQITLYTQRMDKPSQKDAALVREAYERLITNLTAKGQEMINHSFLLIQESNRDLASVKQRAIESVIVATLLAIGLSIGISLLSLQADPHRHPVCRKDRDRRQRKSRLPGGDPEGRRDRTPRPGLR